MDMPAEIDGETSNYVEPDRISGRLQDRMHKVIYCVATLD